MAYDGDIIKLMINDRWIVMKSIVTFILISIFSFSVSANWCNQSYRHENFWISAATKFGEVNAKNRFNDEVCWMLGKEHGAMILNNNSQNIRSCKNAFNNGKLDGLKADTTRSDSPMECYNAGIRYGLSLLVSNARLGKEVNSSSVSCVRNYRQGKSDGSRDVVAQPGQDNISHTCYMAGFQDGMLFRGIF